LAASAPSEYTETILDRDALAFKMEKYLIQRRVCHNGGRDECRFESMETIEGKVMSF
jgi:hypothetical protein